MIKPIITPECTCTAQDLMPVGECMLRVCPNKIKNMNVKELKELIKDLPDDMPFGLLDLSTDDPDLMNYSVFKSSFDTVDWMGQADMEPTGTAFVLCFINKMNENPI